MKHSLYLAIAIFVFIFYTPLEASAETVRIYSGSGDGYTMGRNYTNDWDELHDRSTSIGEELDTEGAFYSGDSDVYVQTSRYYEFGGWNYVAVRPFIPFDTSSIPEDAVIESVTLNLFPAEWRDGNMTIYVVQTSQANIDAVVPEDFDQVGAINDPVEGGSFTNDVPYGEYAAIQLNDSGQGWIEKDGWTKLGLRTSDDAHDNAPISNNGISFHSSEAPGISTDPYLEIEYTLPGEEDSYPLYTQIESPYPSASATAAWANETYADGVKRKCGNTIAGCGCAITSLVMMARAEGVTTAVDGSDVNPGTLNNWLQKNKGYVGGSIKWGKALQFFGVKDDTGVIHTPFTLTEHNDTDASSTQLSAATEGEHVVGFSDQVRGGHYLVISDYFDSQYQVRDPWYFNTKTANDVVSSTSVKVFDYNNTFAKANRFKYREPTPLTGSIEVILASPAELRLRNQAGELAGYNLEGQVVTDIESSSYDQFDSIGNPADTDNDISIHYNKHLMVLQAVGEYGLEVVGTGIGLYTLGVTVFDENGHSHDYDYVGTTTPGQIDLFKLNVETGGIELIDSAEVLDRAAFIALVKVATVDERKSTQRFLVRFAHRIFDAVDRDRGRLALIRLRVFEHLLKVKRINDEDLTAAVEQLWSELRGK